MYNKIIILLLVATLTGCATLKAQAASDGHDLKANLGKSFEEKVVGKTRELRYCPDNTCDAVVVPFKVATDLANDFAWLFFLNVSEYYVLGDFKEKNKDLNKELVEKYRPFCSEKDHTAKCVIQGFARKHGLRAFSVRYDEGAEVKTPISF